MSAFLIRIACFVFMLTPVCAEDQSEASLGQTRAKWPGISLEISKIIRLEGDFILVGVRICADETAANPTILCGAKKAESAFPEPFSLLSATLMDQGSKQEYKADGNLPVKPYLGDPDIITALHPNTWIQLAVRFKVPPPSLPDAAGKIEPQRATFSFPMAEKPIKDILLPQAIGK